MNPKNRAQLMLMCKTRIKESEQRIQGNIIKFGDDPLHLVRYHMQSLLICQFDAKLLKEVCDTIASGANVDDVRFICELRSMILNANSTVRRLISFDESTLMQLGLYTRVERAMLEELQWLNFAIDQLLLEPA